VVVEVDGAVHKAPGAAERDLARTRWIEARGFVMVRVENDEVVADVGGVVQRIIAMARADTPTPIPSPQGGGVQI
jgi:very-short-patch-repair endonuclease